MAERVIAVKMTVDGKESIKELENIQEAMAAIEDEIRNVDKTMAASTAEEAFRELNKIVDQNALSIQELGTAADNYKNIALAAGKTSPIGKEALKMAAQMEREMTDLTMEVDQLAQRGRRLNTALTLGSTVIAGYGALEGVQAALGVENEELEKTFVKLQGIMTALASIQEIQIALQEQSIVVDKIKAAGTKVLTVAQKAYTLAVGKSTGAMKLLRLAMMSTGIGLLIAGITWLVTNFDVVKEKAMIVVDAFKRLGTVIAFLINPLGFLNEAYDALFGTVQDEAKQAEKQFKKFAENEAKRHQKRVKDIEEEKNARIDAADEVLGALDKERELLEAQGKSTTLNTIKTLEAEMEKLNAITDANAKKIESYREYYQNLAMFRGEDEEEFKQSMKAQGIDLDLLQQKANELQEENLHNTRVIQAKIDKIKRDAALQQLKDQKALNDSWLEAEEMKLDANLKNWKDYSDEIADIEMEEMTADDFLDPDELDIAMEDSLGKFEQFVTTVGIMFKSGFEHMTDEMKEMLAEIGEGVNMAMASATAVNELMNQLGENRMSDNEARRDEELSNIESQKQAELNQEGLSEKNKLAIEKKFAIEEFKVKKKTAEANDKIAKRQFDRDKALRISQVAIDTATAIVKGIAQFGPPPSPLGIAAIASAGIIGAAQIATIASQKFEGTAGSITPPSFSSPSGGGSGDTGTGATTGGDANVQTDTGTDPNSLLNQQVEVSIVEVQKVASTVNEIDNISTVG
jgi:hypothetical protein